jgi:hypothetical protein
MPRAPAVSKSNSPSKWIKPQLTRLVDEVPPGKDWLHGGDIKFAAMDLP